MRRRPLSSFPTVQIKLVGEFLFHIMYAVMMGDLTEVHAYLCKN